MKHQSAHAPDQRHRAAAELRRGPARSSRASGSSGWPRRHGDVEHELVDGHAVRPRVVGRQQPGADRRRHPLVTADGHADRRPGEQVEAPARPAGPAGACGRAGSARASSRERNAAVLNSTNRPNRSGAATAAPMPIAPPQSWATSVMSRRSSRSTSSRRSPIRRPAGSDTRQRRGLSDSPQPMWSGTTTRYRPPQGLDQLPPVERPGGVAVDHQDAPGPSPSSR